MMRRLFDIGFFLLIALACAGMDFYILKRDQGAPFGVADYIAQRKGDIQDILKPPSLRAAMPSDVAGWSVSSSNADQLVDGDAASRAAQASEIAMVKAVAALEKARNPAGDMAGVTLTKGDTRLRVLAVLAKPVASVAGIDSPAAAAPDPALQAMLQMAAAPAAQAAFSVVDGVPFVEMPATALSADPDLRMMHAQLGGEMSVTVVTKSTDDAAIRAAMQAIDFVMLNKLLQNPVAGVAEGRTTDLRQDAGGANPSGAPASGAAPDLIAAAPDGTQPPAASGATTTATAATTTAAAKAAQPDVLPESAVFVTPPTGDATKSGQPCVRRAGVLVCPSSD